MASFASYDGTEIGYRVLGDGPPLVCLPGGPGRAAEYLGDLGGLGKSRQLVLLDPRGVGLSADPADPATFRVDRLVATLSRSASIWAWTRWTCSRTQPALCSPRCTRLRTRNACPG